MNEFEFLDINDYNIELSDEEKEQTIIEFEDDNFYILKYLLLNDNREIAINGIKFTIEEIYNKLVRNGNRVDKLKNGTEVVVLTNDNYLTDSISGDKTLIKNISRHKVTKDKWEITVPGFNTLLLTADHSIIVYRDGKLIECKPYEILESDYLVVK